MHHDAVHLERGSVDHANIEFDIGAGELTVNGGAGNLLDGVFDYNVEGYKPQIQSTLNGSHAIINVRQAGHNGWGGHVENNWDLKLNDKTMLDMVVNCGAGQANLNLGDMKLRSLSVQMGAGQVDLDLRGHPQHDYEVTISGGVGQASVHLPQDVGVRAEAHGGIGINVTGLEKHGDHYENNLLDKAPITVHLRVEGGIGQIQIEG